MKKLIFAAGVVCGLGLQAQVPNRTVYLEEFDNYADYVACFRAGTRTCEYDTGSLKCLGFAPEADGLAREGYFPIKDSPEGKWTLTFIAENRAKEPSAFTLVLYYGDRSAPETEEHAFTASKGYWQPFHVFSKDARRLVGWNLKGAAGASIVVDRMRVEQGVHRPYRLGDPADWLAKLPPVKDEPLPADFGEAMEPKKPYAVDLEKEDLVFKFKCQQPRESLLFKFGIGPNGKPAGEKRITFAQDSDEITLPGEKKATKLPGTKLSVGGGPFWYFPWIYSAPRLRDRYYPMEKMEIYANHDRFPRVTNVVYDVRLARNERGENELWVDGNFCFFFTNAPVTSVFGGPAFRMKREPKAKPSLVQPLSFKNWPEGFPLWYVRENIGGNWLGSKQYACRSCFEAMPSSCLFSVPNRPYVRAKALCRVATDVPEDFEPVVVARLTNYAKHTAGYGRDADACTMAEVRLPRPGSSDPLAKGVVRKGENLYEVTFELEPGKIQDLLYRANALDDGKSRVPQLDFEFTGVLWRHDCCYVDRWQVPDREAQSSVVVLSGELEAAPCDFDVVPNHPFSTYLPHEKVGGRYFIRPRFPGKYAIAWTVTDDAGKVVESGEKRLRSKVEVDSGEINFNVREVGHYNVVYSFTDAGKVLWTHEASFSVIPEDRREAWYESPYYNWTWMGGHGSCRDFDTVMEMVSKLGNRGALMDRGKLSEDNPSARKFKMKQAQFPYIAIGSDKNGSWEQSTSNAIKRMKSLVERFPHTKRALVFHESGGGPFPQELVGGKTEMTDELREQDAMWVKRAEATAKAWRSVDPSVKLVYGNTTASYGLLAHLFRGGIRRDLVDFVGEETVGCSAPPEWDTARVPWNQREIARLFGYEGVKSDCPFEWKARAPRNLPEPGYFGPAYYIRDCLIAHGLNYTLIPMCGGTTSADGYQQSIWGHSSGQRWPLAYPSRAVNACATLTDLLDTGKFQKLLPTGSLSVFCEEFLVKGRCVYAIWTGRGETELTLDLGENADYETVSLTGARKAGETARTVVVSDEPRYLVTAKPLKGATAALQRRFPHEEIAFARRAVAVPLASADEAVVVEGRDRRLLSEHNPFQRPGPFAIKTAQDPLKGACVELTDLSGTEKTPKPVMNCTFLRFPKAQPVEGEYDSIGVWVEGNSGWGRVWFEVTDAEGEVWVTSGSGGYGGDEYDWPKTMSVNFDGWHFLKFPLTAESPVKVASPGENEEQLTRDGSGNGRIDYPVKVTGLGVGNMPWGLDFLEMRPTRGYLRFKDVTLLAK